MGMALVELRGVWHNVKLVKLVKLVATKPP